MAKNHIKEGKTMTWLNGTGSPVVSGEVVPLPNMIAVALGDIPVGSEGELATEEVWELDKETPLDIAAGDDVFWDAVNNRIDKTGSNVAAGKAWAPAASADTKVQVKINA